MKRNPLILAIGIILIAIVGLLLFAFQVRKTEVAVVTTFGKPTRPITQPGFKLKWPWPIQQVYKFDQRTHNYESKFEQVQTRDGYGFLITVYVGWNIADPTLYFPRFGDSTSKAEESLEGLVRNSYSGVVGGHPFSHFISTDEKELKFVEIEQEMLKKIQADAQANNYGIEIKFLGIKKLGLPESVTEKVFEHMRAERQVLVERIQSEGQKQAAIIRATADRDSASQLADADAEAIRIRGLGDAAAAETFKVFEQSPDLATFLLKLNALELFLQQRSTLILDANTPPLGLLKGYSPGTHPKSALTSPADAILKTPAPVQTTNTP